MCVLYMNIGMEETNTKDGERDKRERKIIIKKRRNRGYKEK